MQIDMKKEIERIWIESFIGEFCDQSVNIEYSKDNRDIKTNLEVLVQRQGLIVYIIACKPNSNLVTHLSCEKGKPISKGAYDVTTDSYIVAAVDYCKIGDIPVNFKLQLKDDDHFMVDIPAPERVLKRYMSENQLDKLDSFKSKYKTGYDFKFLQLLKAY